MNQPLWNLLALCVSLAFASSLWFGKTGTKFPEGGLTNLLRDLKKQKWIEHPGGIHLIHRPFFTMKAKEQAASHCGSKPLRERPLQMEGEGVQANLKNSSQGAGPSPMTEQLFVCIGSQV